MNIDAFKTKVLSININDQLFENDRNMGVIRQVHNALDVLKEFVEDDKNLELLSNYNQKKEKNSEQSPLYGLCESVIKKLEQVDELLNPEIIEYLRHNKIQSEIERRHINNEIHHIKNELDESFGNMLAVYRILKHLDGHSKTLIILGPNGSGKTSFANYIKKLDTHVKVIPASKPIMATGYIPSMYNSTLMNYNDELYSGGILDQSLLQKLIIGICSEHDDIAREFLDKKIMKKESTYKIVKSIFDDFFDVKLDDSGFGIKEMRAQKESGNPFGFNGMSDGERVAFFYIATVVAAPKQSFIVVDEPENHLNPAIYNKIWEKLIEYRKDCQFIFISHTMDFINARSNFELVKIKNFIYPDKFEFEFLGDSLESIKSESVIEIVGSRKPILFCEGSKTDYDYKIYDGIFGEKYTVIPVGNCTSVERSVEACNHYTLSYSIQSAIGIIDSDLKSHDEIDRLKEKRIYTLRCNEIEMLLVDEEIFKRALIQVFKPTQLFEKYKQEFFKKIENRKDYIIKRLVKTQIDEMLHNSFIDDKKNITKEEIKENLLCIIRKIEADAIWQNKEEQLATIIELQNYDEALRYCCLEHGEIIAGVANHYISGYASIALGVLKEDSELTKAIQKRYFQEIDISRE